MCFFLRILRSLLTCERSSPSLYPSGSLPLVCTGTPARTRLVLQLRSLRQVLPDAMPKRGAAQYMVVRYHAHERQVGVGRAAGLPAG